MRLIHVLFFLSMPIIFVFSYVRPVQYEKREDSHYLTRKEFTDGTSSLGNSFSTLWLPWQTQRVTQKIEPNTSEIVITGLVLSSDRYSFTLLAPQGDTIVVHTAYYPGWNVYVDEQREEIDYTQGDIRFRVPTGTHAVQIKLESTTDQKMAYGITFLSLCVLALLIIIRSRFQILFKSILRA